MRSAKSVGHMVEEAGATGLKFQRTPATGDQQGITWTGNWRVALFWIYEPTEGEQTQEMGDINTGIPGKIKRSRGSPGPIQPDVPQPQVCCVWNPPRKGIAGTHLVKGAASNATAILGRWKRSMNHHKVLLWNLAETVNHFIYSRPVDKDCTRGLEKGRHQREPHVSVSRSIFALVTRTRQPALFGSERPDRSVRNDRADKKRAVIFRKRVCSSTLINS